MTTVAVQVMAVVANGTSCRGVGGDDGVAIIGGQLVMLLT